MTLRTAIALSLVSAAAGYGLHLSAQQLHRWRLTQQDYAAPPAGMVFVPAGAFLTGSDDPRAADDEGPLRAAFLPGYYIDTYEVTNAEFAKFDPAHTFEPGREHYPATGITLERARAYAASVGKRLPTRAEWEKAARGTDGRTYTWGDEFRPGLANLGGNDDLVEVGRYPESVSPYGAHDMIGNAWEWVDDIHYERTVFPDAPRPQEIIKGGAYSYNPFQGRASYNGFEGVGLTCNDVGFRCVKDAAPVE